MCRAACLRGDVHAASIRNALACSRSRQQAAHAHELSTISEHQHAGWRAHAQPAWQVGRPLSSREALKVLDCSREFPWWHWIVRWQSLRV